MSQNKDMIIGTLQLRLIIRGAHSLKDRRRVVNSLKDRIRARFNASVAEVGPLEDCRVAHVGVAVVANDRTFIQSVLTQIGNLASGIRDAELASCDMEIL